jgi:hypothetical protein
MGHPRLSGETPSAISARTTLIPLRCPACGYRHGEPADLGVVAFPSGSRRRPRTDGGRIVNLSNGLTRFSSAGYTAYASMNADNHEINAQRIETSGGMNL